MESTTPPLAVIGGGNMASAILRGGLASGVLKAQALAVAEPDEAKRTGFESLGVRAFPDAATVCRWLQSAEPTPGTGQVLLAVKPQAAAALADELRPVLGPVRRVVISILAGTPSEKLRNLLGAWAAVVRVMPNTPAQIGRGMSGVALGAGAGAGDEAFALRVFRGVGDAVVIDESLMDAFTAVAGSGPAYVFYLAEAMLRAAVEVGFEPEVALRVVRATVGGAGELLAGAPDPPERLRAAVTSKGGTTAAAIEVLDHAGAAEAVVRAITAARDRGRDLAGA